MSTPYKTLDEDGRSPYQGFEWPLPDGDEPGEWVGPVEGELVECENGLHVCTLEQLPWWLDATLYVVETREGTDWLDGEDKTVLREARLTRRVETWTETTARLFAADCAEMVLPIYERAHPDDGRPRRAIETVRAYALGEATDEDLAAAGAAAWDAARDATRAAARDAAWAAAWDAARDAARAAAWDAARAAAWDAARDAARAAAWDAARAAITGRLALYLEMGPDARHEPLPSLDPQEVA